jgi:N4-gp56 family major capsid protein
MAETTVPTNSRVIRWERKFYREWIRDNRFAKLTGADASAPIQMKEDLTRNIGEEINFTLVNRLTNAATVGKATLKGNEEDQKIRNYRIKVTRYRHAVLHDTLDEQFSAIDLVEAERATLMDWAKELQRDRILEALGSISTNGSTHTAYASASEADKDTWAANNSDRIVFGAAAFNSDHSAGLAQLDTTNDLLLRATLQNVKDAAKSANPKIRPLRVRDDEEWYVALAPTPAFRDMQADLATINQNAMDRGKDNPLFTGGDLLWDGVVIKEVPEIASLGTVGASSAAVYPVYLLGAQAIAHAVASRTKMISDVDDYGAKKGAGVQLVDAIRKIYFGSGADDATTPKQHGLATLYVASAN